MRQNVTELHFCMEFTSRGDLQNKVIGTHRGTRNTLYDTIAKTIGIGKQDVNAQNQN